MHCDWATGDWRHLEQACSLVTFPWSLHSRNEMLRERIKRGILQGCTKYS